MKPPRLAEWCLVRSLAPGEREYVPGDLEEEFRAIAAGRGRRAAVWWYRAQVLRSLPFNLMRRRPPGARPVEPRKDSRSMTLWHELRYAVRTLRRTPSFSIPAGLILALGIGVATTVFTVIHRVVLSPLPYPDAGRLVRLWDRNEGAGLPYFSVSPSNYFTWRRQSRTLATVGAYREDGFTLQQPGGPERIDGARVTSTLLEVLGVKPAQGRSIAASDDRPGAEHVAMVSHALAGRLSGPDAVVGRVVTLDGIPHTLVGVLPPDFHFPQQEGIDVLVPHALNDTAPEAAAHFLRVLGRLAPGADLAQARAELQTIAGRLQAESPRFNRGWTVVMEPLRDATVGDVEQPLYVLLGAAALLFLITGANVAGLQLARSASRGGELAIRSALGAGIGRITRQLAVESLVLSAAGTAAGVLLGAVALDALLAVNPEALPRREEIAMDGRVLAVAAALCAATSLLLAVLPALIPTLRPDLRVVLARTGRGARGGAQPFRRMLVAGEIALALSLVVGAALLVGNLVALMRIDPGFQTSGVLTIDLRPPAGRYADPAARTRLYRRIVEELQRLPGVTAAGGAHRLPLDGNSAIPLVIEGRPRPPGDEVPSVTYRAVAGGYFQALDIPLRRGRFFSEAEAWQTGGAVIINQAAAERYFDGTDPLAQRLLAAGDRALQIVGVVENVKESALDQPAEPALYVPYAALPVPGMALVLRSASPPEGLIRAARTAIADVDPSLAPARARTLDAFLRTVIAQPRFNTLLLTLFAGIALAIAGVGVYGVTAYSVVQRTSEIGVRMALGARRFDIFKTIVAPGLTLAALGTALGIGGAVLLARFLGGTVFGVDARQPAVYAGTALLLFAVAAAATMLPARRAMLVDPVRSLRQE